MREIARQRKALERPRRVRDAESLAREPLQQDVLKLRREIEAICADLATRSVSGSLRRPLLRAKRMRLYAASMLARIDLAREVSRDG